MAQAASNPQGFQLRPVSLKTAKQVLIENLTARKPVIVLGQPGVGKTAINYEVAEHFGFTADQVYPFDIPTKMAPDLGGGYAPDVANGLMTLCAPSDLPRGPGILTLEDLTAAPRDMFAPCLALLGGRNKIGAWTRHPDLHVVGNGNRPEDMAGAVKLTSALGNRCEVVVVEADPEEWIDWSKAKGVFRPAVAYIQTNPGALNAFRPVNAVNATSRSWTHLADVMAANHGKVSMATVEGWIGDQAPGFMGWYKAVLTLPTPDEVKANPLGVRVPTDPAGLSILLTSLAATCKPTDAKQIILFIMRPEIHSDFRARVVRDLTEECERLRIKTGGHAQLVDSSAWTQFRIDHAGLFID